MAQLARMVALAAAALAAISLAGCASSSTGSAGSSTPAPTPSSTSSIHPGSLVGVWTLGQKVDAPEQPFVSFVQDNTWVASDGCNRVRGTWNVDADGTLTTTSGPQTMMACDGAQIPLAVTEGTHVSVNGDYLTITSAHGAAETQLVRSTDPTVGPSGRPIGYWTETRTSTSPFLSISTDGTYSGSDGCNRLAGSWTSNADDSITFSQGISTLMACEGVDTWLSGLASGTVRAGVMTIQSADGTVLGQLTAL
ncbi:META domain-containing protein [Subtercola sp. PAMC28395]|uniref:META domain-containing protein n=1 Tax=Subtercola sp. PAMC28395 TaxID=2846775 RepID=UPI001C0C51C8|nr:META domain-containing protein [Subtercola sp. PAMC28395]QWT23971.1 META domain-containing protein [Subtercola sp. PAMC28395]